MKSFIGFCLILFYSPLFGQWENISIQTSKDFTAVSFMDDNIGFVAGGNEIYKTENGGVDWVHSFVADTFVQLDDILVINDTLVLAVGQDFKDHKSIILRTSDSGMNWSLIENQFLNYLTSIFFIDDQHGFGVGRNNIIFKTEDSGLHWDRVNSPAPGNTRFESIFFSNPMNGYAVGGGPDESTYCRTTDGGMNWGEFIIDSDSYLQSVFFTDSIRGYIVGWNGEILVTDDGGTSWTDQVSVNMAGNLEIIFTNDSTGYIVGGMQNEASIQKTTDKGLNWVEIGPEINKGLIGVDFPSENTGYAVGATGTILKTINGGFSSVIDSKNKINLTIYPNPVINMVNIQSDLLISEIQIFDASGSKLETITYQSYNFSKNLTHYPSGNYFILIKAGTASGVFRFVKL